jgi:hypothetical protein
MEIQLADQRLFNLPERISPDEIRQRAMDKRSSAFASGIGGLLSLPKPEDIELVGTQRRLDPFWHVACRAINVYDRSRDYQVAASATEVREVSVNGVTYPVVEGRTPRSFTMPTVEHCRDEMFREVYVDGISGAAVADGATVTGGPKAEIGDPAELATDDTVVLPPEHRASYVVRQLISETLKPVQADTVAEESLTLERTDLYYRPVWAFEFHWKTKDKRGVVEIDALTGQSRQASSLAARAGRMMTRDNLFDIGADTVGMLVPGGSIAVKVAKMAIDHQANKSG